MQAKENGCRNTSPPSDTPNQEDNNNTTSETKLKKVPPKPSKRVSFLSTSKEKINSKTNNIEKNKDSAKTNFLNTENNNNHTKNLNNSEYKTNESTSTPQTDNRRDSLQQLKSEFVKTSETSNIPVATSWNNQKTSTPKRENDSTDLQSRLTETQSKIAKLQQSLPTKLSDATVQSLKNKYSPSNFGYPKNFPKPEKPVLSKIPSLFPKTPTLLKSEVKTTEKNQNSTKENNTSKENSPNPEKDTGERQKYKTELFITPEIDIENLSPSEETDSDEKTINKPTDPIVQDQNQSAKDSENKLELITEVLPKSECSEQVIVLESDDSDTVTQSDDSRNSQEKLKNTNKERNNSEKSSSNLTLTEDLSENSEMEDGPKKSTKKRSNSFKRIFGFGSKEKKKPEPENGKSLKNGLKRKEGQNENYENESNFDRGAAQRHTFSGHASLRSNQENIKPGTYGYRNTNDRFYERTNAIYANQPQDDRHNSSLPLGMRYQREFHPQTNEEEKNVTERERLNMNHIQYDLYLAQQTNKRLNSSLNMPINASRVDEYVCMDNMDKQNRNDLTQPGFINSQGVSKYIDTTSSSSTCTLESDNQNGMYENAVSRKLSRGSQSDTSYGSSLSRIPSLRQNSVERKLQNGDKPYERPTFSNSPEMFIATPKKVQDPQLIKPKAIIPINTERSLPNPYRNNNAKDDSKNDQRALFDSYGNLRNPDSDNFDSIPRQSQKENDYGKPIPAVRRNFNVDNNANGPNTPTDYSEDDYGTVYDSLSPVGAQLRITKTNVIRTQNKNVDKVVPQNVSPSLRQQSPQEISPPQRQNIIRSSPSLRQTSNSPQNISPSFRSNSLSNSQNFTPPMRTSSVSSNQNNSPSFRANSGPSPQNMLPSVRPNSISPSFRQNMSPRNSSPSLQRQNAMSPTNLRASPKIEAQKLKLSPNREKLEPRLKSPIDEKMKKEVQGQVEKKKEVKKKTDDEAPSHQNLEIEIDYPENNINEEVKKETPEKEMFFEEPGEQENVPSSPQRVVKIKRSPHVSPVRPKSLQSLPKSPNDTIDNISKVRSPITVRTESPISVGSSLSLKSSSSSKLPASSDDLKDLKTTEVYFWEQTNKTSTPLKANNDETKDNSPEQSPQHVLTQVVVHQQPPVSPRKDVPTSPRKQRISPTVPVSPQKQQNMRNLEAFYWQEIKKLKEKEEMEIYNQQVRYLHRNNSMNLGPVIAQHRSRSMSPAVNRPRDKRSLSLPREAPPQRMSEGVYGYATKQEMIPEDRQIQYQTYGILQRQPIYPPNQNFIRGTNQRSTIASGSIQRRSQDEMIYENYFPGVELRHQAKSGYQPIFKRGSLTNQQQQSQRESQSTLNKKVSFTSAQGEEPQAWPTRNGYTQSPPTRRVDKKGDTTDDEVFYPNNYQNLTPAGENEKNMQQQNLPNKIGQMEAPYGTSKAREGKPYGTTQARESPYGTAPARESPYGIAHGRNDPKQPKVDPIYERRQVQTGPQQNPDMQNLQNTNNVNMNEHYLRKVRSVSVEPLYISRKPPQYPSPDAIYAPRPTDPIYGRTQKQITINNKVCDMYGQIHEQNPNLYGNIQNSGVIYGQLQQNPIPGSPLSLRNQVLNRSDPSFVRGGRLTASFNDMRPHGTDAPRRPLPATPMDKLVSHRAGMVLVSDTESGSEAGEVQRILQNRERIQRQNENAGTVTEDKKEASPSLTEAMQAFGIIEKYMKNQNKPKDSFIRLNNLKKDLYNDNILFL